MLKILALSKMHGDLARHMARRRREQASTISQKCGRPAILSKSAKARVRDLVSASPIGKGATRVGGANPKTCRYQNVDHSMIGN